MTRLHSKAGYGHIVLKKELMGELHSRKVLTPHGKESYSDLIKRLLNEREQKPKVLTLNNEEKDYLEKLRNRLATAKNPTGSLRNRKQVELLTKVLTLIK